jgi:hypothetical protein
LKHESSRSYYSFLISISFSYSQTKDSLIALWWVEKFKLTAGLFVPVNNTRVQVEANGSAAGTDIDFKKDLGFGASQLTFLANLQWRISRRSRISLTYYNMRRSSTHRLTKDIIFNDQTYKVDNIVDTYLILPFTNSLIVMPSSKNRLTK